RRGARNFCSTMRSARGPRFNTRSSSTRRRTNAVSSCRHGFWPSAFKGSSNGTRRLWSAETDRSVGGYEMFVVISYDIRDDRRRGRIFKALKNFGQWMQFSVFECELDRANFLRLKDRLDHLIDAEQEDSVRFYFLCEGCKRQVERVGGEKPRKEGAGIV